MRFDVVEGILGNVIVVGRLTLCKGFIVSPQKSGAESPCPSGLSRRRKAGITAIPAYAPKVLCDDGSEQLSERFDHPFVSFDVSFVIGHGRLSCGTQTDVVIEA